MLLHSVLWQQSTLQSDRLLLRLESTFLLQAPYQASRLLRLRQESSRLLDFSWLRSFSGLLVTCGLDHALLMGSEDAAHYRYANRPVVDQPLHGRIANIPGRLLGYGECWQGDDCVLWCEGQIEQAAVYRQLVLT